MIEYTIPPVHIKEVIMAIENQTLGCSRAMRTYLRVAAKTRNIARKVMFLIRIVVKGNTNWMEVFKRLFMKSIMV